MTSQWNNNFGQQPPPVPPGRDSFKNNRRGRTSTILAVSIAVVAVAVIVGVLTITWFSQKHTPGGAADDSSSASHDATSDADASKAGGTADDGHYPDKGSYRLKQVASDLCMSWGPEKGNKQREVTVFADCAKATPKLTWTPQSKREFVVTMAFAKPAWTACLTADPPATKPGYLFGAKDCTKGAPLQTLVLTAEGSGEYILQVKSTKMCLGPLEQEAKRGMAFSTEKCSDADKALRFTLE
ncbi:MAG TPA: hypothetical protein VE172_07100 [Stackebrandtia sp.]|jgi:hypothetical protein|uniref:hypothetical protein n=1 Tax=Stackebrandtia sp. TaxID=2023065 RepID=UPI002D55101D|nr:hypothetical protein [Stackebrandtia sp.]HZE38567.1 hypothetical protein [Stackebrandtia sp.]